MTTSYGYDRLGSVRAEYNASGALNVSYDYDPYGVPEGRTAPSDYGFTGEPYDGEHGLVHLRARWYAPGQGRFLSRDPFEGEAKTPQSLHAYAYVHNDPINSTDPTGKWRWQGTGSRYHEWIENNYMALAPHVIHAEYNDFRKLGFSVERRVDLINELTGDVYEIEPIYAAMIATPEAMFYTGLLRFFGIDAPRFGMQPGLVGFYPIGVAQGIYDWNHVAWQLGDSGRGPRGRADWPPVAHLVWVSPWPGATLDWLEPKDHTQQAWRALKYGSGENARLIRPYLWRLGDPEWPEFDPPLEPLPPEYPRVPHTGEGGTSASRTQACEF